MPKGTGRALGAGRVVEVIAIVVATHLEDELGTLDPKIELKRLLQKISILIETIKVSI